MQRSEASDMGVLLRGLSYLIALDTPIVKSGNQVADSNSSTQ